MLCAVCHQGYADANARPTLLPCGHSFHSQCLTSQSRLGRTSSGRCPECAPSPATIQPPQSLQFSFCRPPSGCVAPELSSMVSELRRLPIRQTASSHNAVTELTGYKRLRRSAPKSQHRQRKPTQTGHRKKRRPRRRTLGAASTTAHHADLISTKKNPLPGKYRTVQSPLITLDQRWTSILPQSS